MLANPHEYKLCCIKLVNLKKQKTHMKLAEKNQLKTTIAPL